MAYVAANPKKLKGNIVGNGHCVAYARQTAIMPPTPVWRQGDPVRGNNRITVGSAIATFDEKNSYGNRTDGTSHVAIYLGQDAVGIQVLDQWVGQPVHERTIYFRDAAHKVNDGRNYYVVE
jgi:hypothetical protein